MERQSSLSKIFSKLISRKSNWTQIETLDLCHKQDDTADNLLDNDQLAAPPPSGEVVANPEKDAENLVGIQNDCFYEGVPWEHEENFRDQINIKNEMIKNKKIKNPNDHTNDASDGAGTSERPADRQVFVMKKVPEERKYYYGPPDIFNVPSHPDDPIPEPQYPTWSSEQEAELQVLIRLAEEEVRGELTRVANVEVWMLLFNWWEDE